jgi:hypothetical protein
VWSYKVVVSYEGPVFFEGVGFCLVGFVGGFIFAEGGGLRTLAVMCAVPRSIQCHLKAKPSPWVGLNCVLDQLESA